MGIFQKLFGKKNETNNFQTDPNNIGGDVNQTQNTSTYDPNIVPIQKENSNEFMNTSSMPILNSLSTSEPELFEEQQKTIEPTLSYPSVDGPDAFNLSNQQSQITIKPVEQQQVNSFPSVDGPNVFAPQNQINENIVDEPIFQFDSSVQENNNPELLFGDNNEPVQRQPENNIRIITSNSNIENNNSVPVNQGNIRLVNNNENEAEIKMIEPKEKAIINQEQSNWIPSFPNDEVNTNSNNGQTR